MIQCIFTLDYEIYGNGEGSLRELVLEPTRLLAGLFREFDAPFVVFAEALEFARMEDARSDPESGAVRADLRALRAAGHEIALHVHPWWANARYANQRWHLDWSERNICSLSVGRVDAILSSAIGYLRKALQDPLYTPVSFRSGLWAMQPTGVVAAALVRHGLRVDSSVFKGGRIRSLALDYRPALRNGDFWRFEQDVNVPDAHGTLWEIPIHTEMVPCWAMLRRKRLELQQRMPRAAEGTPLPRRWRDFVRIRYPRKLDFCRMTFAEMRDAFERALEDRSTGRKLIVAIGHTKDLVDSDAIGRFLDFLLLRDVSVTTFSRLFGQEPGLVGL